MRNFGVIGRILKILVVATPTDRMPSFFGFFVKEELGTICPSPATSHGCDIRRLPSGRPCLFGPFMKYRSGRRPNESPC